MPTTPEATVLGYAADEAKSVAPPSAATTAASTGVAPLAAVELDDVQALARFGHGHLRASRFLLLSIVDRHAAGRWLASVEISTAVAREPPPARALQLALTVAGLRRLGAPESLIEQFPDEFLGGMHADESRSRRLGDVGESAPEHWLWGARDADDTHLLAMIYAREDDIEAAAAEITGTEGFHAAFALRHALPTDMLGAREPFGFVDGISQPSVDWEQRQGTDTHERSDYSNRLALGEVLLGYPNEYGQYSRRPLVDAVDDARALALPLAADSPRRRDFGRNGSFLVLRQLEQDVGAFWRYLDTAAKGDGRERERLGALMVGRRRDGTPLAPPSARDIPGIAPGNARNRFDYAEDLHGFRCPVGAHVRRSNPRGGDMPPGVRGPLSWLVRALGFKREDPYEDLVASARFHRMLRRGRTYGGAVLEPEQALALGEDGAPRGLQFACLVGSILRQFEFVQNSWSISSQFAGVNGESDPLIGSREPRVNGTPTDTFRIARVDGAPRRLEAIPRFVRVRGGAYLFLPGVRALRYVGALAASAPGAATGETA